MRISDPTHEDVARQAHPRWPALPYAAWRDTLETVHRWSQVIGKIALALTPTTNHWWNAALRPTTRGLATGMIPYGERWFDLELDFVDGFLHLRTSDGGARSIRLGPISVADFYTETLATLAAAGIDVGIWPVPVEIEDPVPLHLDTRHRSYDPHPVLRFWTIVGRVSQVLAEFRARFVGKASEPLFFWGTFDLSASRFSGRRAPALPQANLIEREAYSHEVFSVGWWPGDARLERPSFFAYIAPEPAGFAEARISTAGAYYDPVLHGFYLPYDLVRQSVAPRATLLEFFQTTYDAAADLAHWDRAELERERPTEH